MSAPRDLLRFLDPWTLLLPESGGRVLAAVGSGGKTALLSRLHRHYRDAGKTVLWTQTVPHPAPEGLLVLSDEEQPERLSEVLAERGSLFVAGPPLGAGVLGGVDPVRLEELRRRLEPGIVLVEAQAPCGTPLRRDGLEPIWPRVLHLAFTVVGLQGVGMLWGPRSVAGEETPPTAGSAEPRRVQSEEALEQLLGEEGLVARVPEEVPVLPFLAGFGAYRDVDGMFALVARLWEEERLRAVLLGELVGEARIDQAERLHATHSPSGPTHLEGERVYALYPAHLDEES